MRAQNAESKAQVPVPSEAAGEAELVLQGYYLGGKGQPFTSISGFAGSSSEFLPHIGLLTMGLEGYGSNGLRTGNVYVGLQGVALWNWHWDFTGGDFRFPSDLTTNPFTNLYTPEISARGARVGVKRSNRAYQLFFGEESVLGGPRIPYRTVLPQFVLGATMQQKIGTRWELGARYLNLSSSPDAFTRTTAYTLPGHRFLNSNSLALQSTYTLIKGQDTKGLKLYAEAGYGRAKSLDLPIRQQPLSFVIGPSWETEKFSIKANFVQQSSSYLPLLGIFAGDRKGPYAEGHYRPLKWVDLYGSATAYSNNLEKNPNLPTFRSRSYVTGTSLALPYQFNFSGSVSTVELTERDPSSGDIPSNNRQINVSLGRPIGRHNPRVSMIDLQLTNNGQQQHQRLTEFGDSFGWKRLVIGGSVRTQQSKAQESRSTVFYRGSLQFSAHRVSMYGNVELGNDLLNQSVFSTNAFNTTLIGASVPLMRHWTMHAEAFRNTLNTALNPENVFLFGNSGLGANTQLAALNQWSVLFRISRQFHWGKVQSGTTDLSQYAAVHVPLVGVVQGLVMEQSISGQHPAPNVAVSVDSNRTVTTDSAGRYVMSDVPEGPHDIALNLDQLPTDYAPGPDMRIRAAVRPRGAVRADFLVYRLTGLTGQIAAPKDAVIENIVVRLRGTSLYTTPEADGTFAFSNLREGHYEVIIDEKTIPEDLELVSPSSVALDAIAPEEAASSRFELRARAVEVKPIREMKLQSQPIRVK
jgi:hypothetical protein